MIFREADSPDIPEMHVVRMAVKENVLSNPNLVTPADSEQMIHTNGKGWVCEIDNRIVGFSIVDLSKRNIWALFVHPDFDKRGIGKQLQKLMLDWAFIDQKTDWLYLGTDPNSRAQTFYEMTGWTATGSQPNGEIRFEMTRETWLSLTRQMA